MGQNGNPLKDNSNLTKTNMIKLILVAAVSAVLFALALSVVLGLPVMLLWNWTLPSLFGVPVIGFWQAVGVNLLCSFLFKTSLTVKD